MKTCSNYQTQFEGNYFPTRQTPFQCDTPALPLKKKGTISAFIRLLLMAVCDVCAIATLFSGMFRETSMTLLEQFGDTFASGAMLVFLGVWSWGFVKWCVFAIPKTYRAAKKMAHTIIPLSLLAFFAELMIFIWLTLIPISLYGMTLTPVLAVGLYIQANPTNILVPLILLLVSAVPTFFLGRMEFRKVFGRKTGEAAK